MGLFSRSLRANKAVTHKQVGDRYESLAKEYLLRQGLLFIEQNYLTKCGEIDLIMRHNNTLVFVEVKYRKHAHYGSAAEMVTYRKAQKLYKAANLWLLKQGLSVHSTDFRFDVVAIQGSDNNINWIQNAITQG